MELTHDFRVGVPPAEAWRALTDVERIAPCLPGASLDGVEGDEYKGTVKVKVGPITAAYKGVARFLEQDEAGGRAVLRAEGRDTRGQGNASATVTATLVPDGDGTAVTVVTDLTITGKVAQFGRGVLADVSGKLLGQFVTCLEADLLAAPAPAPAPTPTPGADGASSTASAATEPQAAALRPVPGATTPPGGEVAPVDLLSTAGAPVVRRIGPVVGLVVTLLWLYRRRRRRLRLRRS